MRARSCGLFAAVSLALLGCGDGEGSRSARADPQASSPRREASEASISAFGPRLPEPTEAERAEIARVDPRVDGWPSEVAAQAAERTLRALITAFVDPRGNMEALRDGIGLRGYGQRDPKKEYQKEGFDLFLELMQNIKSSVVQKMFHFVIEREDEVERLEAERRRRVAERQERMRASHVAAAAATAGAAAGAAGGAGAVSRWIVARSFGAGGSCSLSGSMTVRCRGACGGTGAGTDAW